MKRNVDDEIRKRLQNQDIDIPEGCRKRIEVTMLELSDKKVIKGSRKIRTALVIAIVCILVPSITVFSAINFVKQRMEKLSQEEKDDYYQGVQSSTANADSYSREMTESENIRIKELRAKYENGTFPKKALSIVDTQEVADKNAELYFVEDKSLFVLPKRELTDEEILEIIDFYYCRDYSLTEKVEKENIEYVGDNPEDFIKNGGMDKEDALELAELVINNIYGTECQEFDNKINFEDGGEFGNFYSITFKDKKVQKTYIITVDADKKLVIGINYLEQNNNISSDIKVDHDKFIAKYKDALDTLTNKMGIALPIVQATCEYNSNSEGFLPYGIVNYVFEMEDGTGYVFQYSCTNDVFFNIYLMNYDEYRQVTDQKESQRKEKGFVRKITKMQ